MADISLYSDDELELDSQANIDCVKPVVFAKACTADSAKGNKCATRLKGSWQIFACNTVTCSRMP
jgi:hypothetical protein